MRSNWEIARSAYKEPIANIARGMGLIGDEIETYGNDKAKISLDVLPRLADDPSGKYILVTAMTPTPLGEGKTVTTIGLSMALNRIGKRAIACIRQPSMGPVFGIKGSGAGGGYAQVIPADDLNLHFTGDMHAVSTAHNLLAAFLDAHLHHGNKLNIDPSKVILRRVIDLSDLVLRQIVVGLGGKRNEPIRETGFDLTPASEVMAILALASDLGDLRIRLGRMVVATDRDGGLVTAEDLKCAGAMTVLLKDAIKPNLIQTLENTPCIVHAGPFGNIAHGNSSIIADKIAIKLADYVVTEAGFGADMGAEKFFNIKCRLAGLNPSAAVIVATVRALKMHGGVGKDDIGTENADAVNKGCDNLARHVHNVKSFGVPTVVAVNRFSADTDTEVAAIGEGLEGLGVEVIECTHWADGSAGTQDLARHVADLADKNTHQFAPLYDDKMALWDKVKTIATKLYGADDIIADKKVRNQFADLQEDYGTLPVCMAKTQYSFSTDPNLKGAPSGHVVPIREVRLSAGAGFVVVVCGDIMTMPGLPRVPAANAIHLNKEGMIEGLF
ncbi:MAG: formate--tetrahydrofolate ligase [Proteobacteria bacterium]|nr:formate--tetrahydrofolate ligase [Pseudomonadota bacterium]